jgi:hypothetical protein
MAWSRCTTAYPTTTATWRFFSGFRPPRSFFERLVNVGELAAAARQDFVPWRASARLRNVESWR